MPPNIVEQVKAEEGMMQKYLPKTWIPPPLPKGSEWGKSFRDFTFLQSLVLRSDPREFKRDAQAGGGGGGERGIWDVACISTAERGSEYGAGGSSGAKVVSLLLPTIHIVESRRLKAPKVQ